MRITDSFVKGFGEGFREFGHLLSTPVNAALLTMVYLAGVGPTAVAAKLAGKRFLITRQSKDEKSYWQDLKLGTRPMDDYRRQF